MFARRGWMLGCLLGSVVAASPLDARPLAAPALHRLLAEEEANYRPARVALARAVAGWFFAIREVVAPRPRRLSADGTVESLHPRMRVLRVAIRRPRAESATGSVPPSLPSSRRSAGDAGASLPPARPEPAIRTPARPRRVAGRRAGPAAPSTSPVPAGGLALGPGTHPVVGFGGKSLPSLALAPEPAGEEVDPTLYAVAAIAHGRIETGGEDWKFAVSVSRDLDTVRLRVKRRFNLGW